MSLTGQSLRGTARVTGVRVDLGDVGGRRGRGGRRGQRVGGEEGRGTCYDALWAQWKREDVELLLV